MKNQAQQDFKKGKLIHVILLISSICVIVAANSYFKDQLVLSANLVYLPINIVLVATSVYFLLEFRKKISMLALVSVVGMAVSWLVAEVVWMMDEMILQIEPFPSPADVFYIVGYPLLLAFLCVVGKTTKVPKQIQIISGAVGLIFLIPTLVAATTVYGDDPFEFALAGTYTIFDAFLIWLTLNVILSINNKQNFFWILLLIGFALLMIADSFFIVLAISNEYYTGHPIEVLFYCSYIAISYGLYYQAKMSKTKKYETIAELFNPVKSISSNFIQNLILISSSVVIMIAVSLIVILGFKEFTTNQATTFSMIMLLSVSIVVILSALTYIMGKKLDVLRQLEKKHVEKVSLVKIQTPKEIQPDNTIPTLLTRIERLEKSNKRVGIITLGSILLTTIVLGSYISENFFDLIPTNNILQSGRYVMQTQDGIDVEKNLFWKIDSDEQLHIDIVNSDLVSSDKIDAIKNAILSEETIEIPNSELGKQPEDASGTYYLGWGGALKKAAENHTDYTIPTNFQIILDDASIGDISIILSDQKQLGGDISYVKTIVDENNAQIIKAYITIFDAKNLKDHDFDLIIKHEFIRALGHADHLISDFVYTTTSDSYISDQDIFRIRQIYTVNQNDHTALGVGGGLDQPNPLHSIYKYDYGDITK